MAKLLLLHFSDAHISNSNPSIWDEAWATKIARSALRNGPYDACLIAFVGDITNRGETAEFDLAEIFIHHIQTELKRGIGIMPLTVVAPGNHDCNLSQSNALRDFALTQRTSTEFSKPEIHNILAAPLENYRIFEGRLDTLQMTERSSTHKTGCLDLFGTKFQVRVFNSPLYTKIRETKGELFLPVNLFTDGWESDAIRISIMHHPTPWFDQTISRDIRVALRNNATISLYGHEHIPEISAIGSYNNDIKIGSLEIDGGVLHGHSGGTERSFITLEIDSESASIQAFSHSWSKTTDYFEVTSLLSSTGEHGLAQIPARRLGFAIGSAFSERLTDAGIIAQTINGRGMHINDIYVDLDLYRGNRRGGADELVRYSELFCLDYINGGLIIQGDEKFGKTSLLYKLFDEYRNRGLIPVYIPLKNHTVKKSGEFLKILKSCVNDIYTGENFDSYVNLPRNRKIIFVDDIDALRTNLLRNDLVDFIKIHSDAFALTTTSKVKLEEVLSNDTSEELRIIPQIIIDQFNSAKRAEMISKWVSATQPNLDEEGFISRIDQLEKGATGVLGHNMVPRAPQMLLIFLQSSNAAGKSSLESGALASYYMFLVTQQLLAAGVNREEVDEYFSYSRHVAYSMHKLGLDYITIDELENCNTEFSTAYFPGNSVARRNVLVNAKLLEPYGGDAYRWRHAYFRYLFLGAYLGDNIDDPKIKDIISEMCRHLYIRENANALLFLAHFSKDPFVFKSIENVVQDLFSEAEKLTLGKDTEAFSEIMREVKRLYVPGNVIAERKQRSIRRAANEEAATEEARGPEKIVKISALEELTVLFKTSEIIGQVLKEQYASIKRSSREPIVIKLFEAYMRACGEILGVLTKNTHALKQWTESKINTNSKTITTDARALKAEELVGELVQVLMFAFFQKIGESISSDKTLDLIKNIDWQNNVESQMFLLACELNLQRPIPIGKIDKLLALAERDPAFIALIRNLVQMRVRMFHTRATDLQALSQRFHIPIKKLQALDFSHPSGR